MIEKVLEAYEVESSKNNSFVDKLQRMNNLIKFLLGTNIVFVIILCILLFIFQNLLTYTLVIVHYAVMHIEITVMEKVRRKKWEKNINEYNEDLNRIAEILKREEFDLYEKTKIKQLIRKFYQAIESEEQKKIRDSSEVKDFIFKYVFPIAAFFAGKINTSISLFESEWIALGIIVVAIVVLIRYGYKSIVELARTVSWNVLEKEKTFVLKLQDLLDRDFKIKQDDLISLK